MSIRINHHRFVVCAAALFFSFCVVMLSGCQHMIRRGQSPDSEVSKPKYSKKEFKGTRIIQEVCGIYGLDYEMVHGIGLAVDLKGTGSAPVDSGQRTFLINELKKNQSVEDIETVLKSDETELVILQGKIPPGTRKGDRFDLEVVTMHSSEATSLENGLVLTTELRPIARLGRGLQRGHIAGTATGRILVNSLFEARSDSEADVHGTVLGGGIAQKDRNLGLRIQSTEFNQKTTLQIAHAINQRFQRDSDFGKDGVAEAKTDRIVELKVPANYRGNIGRYVSVIHHMAFQESEQDRQKRMIELVRAISDPAQAGLAALKLEGMGKKAIPMLKKVLDHQDMEVKFRAAEALAYLKQPIGIPVLQEVARKEPRFRWHALAALASFEETSATKAIKELLHVKSAETRYGAFRALREQAPQDPLAEGHWFGGDFYLHTIESNAEPMVHFARLKRPDIVVFNDQQVFEDNLLFVEAGLTIAAEGPGQISIKRYSAEFGSEFQTCTNRVSDVIATLGSMGIGFADQLKFLREVHSDGMLNSRVVVNASPKLGRNIAQSNNASNKKSTDSVRNRLPEMFRDYDHVSAQASEKPIETTDREDSGSSTTIGKLKNWFAGSR